MHVLVIILYIEQLIKKENVPEIRSPLTAQLRKSKSTINNFTLQGEKHVIYLEKKLYIYSRLSKFCPSHCCFTYCTWTDVQAKPWFHSSKSSLSFTFLQSFPQKRQGASFPRQTCSGNTYKKNAGIAFFVLFSKGILRCSKGIAEGGPGYSGESKRLCGLWSPASHSMQNYCTRVPGFSTCEQDGSLLYCTQRQTVKWKRFFVSSLITVRHCDC